MSPIASWRYTHSSLPLRIYVLRPFIHRRDRMNRTGLGRSQWLEELQQGLIVFGLNGDVVGMLSDCDLVTEYLDTFLGSKIPLGPKFIQHGRPVFASSRTVFGCVSFQWATNIMPSPSFISHLPARRFWDPPLDSKSCARRPLIIIGRDTLQNLCH